MHLEKSNELFAGWRNIINLYSIPIASTVNSTVANTNNFKLMFDLKLNQSSFFFLSTLFLLLFLIYY